MTTQSVVYPRTEGPVLYLSYTVFFITVLKKAMPDTPHLIRTRRKAIISCTASQRVRKARGKWLCFMHLIGLRSVHIWERWLFNQDSDSIKLDRYVAYWFEASLSFIGSPSFKHLQSKPLLIWKDVRVPWQRLFPTVLPSVFLWKRKKQDLALKSQSTQEQGITWSTFPRKS